MHKPCASLCVILMNARGFFRRVQMWGSRDPSWFREFVGVHKGRVNVHPLAWRDTEPARRDGQIADLILGLLCVWIFSIVPRPLFVSFPCDRTYSWYGETIPPSASTDTQSRSAFCNESWRASWLHKQEKDAGNRWRLVSIRCWSSVLLTRTFSR